MASVKNLAASVRDRLFAQAKKNGRPFNELLQYYAMERFLYRLAKSKYAGRFILKGALMLRVWESPESRPTMDIDLLGITSNDDAEITRQIREILSIEVEPDGLHFDATSVRAESITEDAQYQGLRVRFRGILGTAKINMQLDVGTMLAEGLFRNPQAKVDLGTQLSAQQWQRLAFAYTGDEAWRVR